MDKRIHFYIDGSMSDVEKQAFEKELRENPELSDDYNGLNHVLILAKNLKTGSAAPQHITDTVMQQIQRQTAFPAFYKQLLKIAAVIAFILLTGTGIYTSLHRGAGLVPITFTMSAPKAKTVYLLGTFNNWGGKPQQLKRAHNGVFAITVKLKPGIYQYVYRVDNGIIVPDPNARMYADDGFGQKNALIIVKGTNHS